MRRIAAVVMAAVLAVSACGEDSSGTGEAVDSKPSPTEPASTEPSPTEPPATEPPATEPPATEPPATEPPATEPPATEPPPTGTIVVTGTAYEFNSPRPIVGATILVDEVEGVSAVTGEDGSYRLELFPEGEATFTIEAEGFHAIHTQTFDLASDPIDGALVNVNFQTPTEEVYEALYALLEGVTGVPPIGDDSCVIVTTVSDPRVVAMTFAEFIDFHPHGVEGVTAQARPDPAGRIVEPIYFNDDVLPDIAQQLSSIDGGVLWPALPPGRYTVSAEHPTVDFDTFSARCEPGWVVNANPPWGLHGLP